MEIKKGDIVIIKSPLNSKGTEIKKTRPAIVVSPKEMSKFARRAIIVPLTSNTKKIYPFEALIKSTKKDSKACCDQIQTVSTERVIEKCGSISYLEIKNLDIALKEILQI